MSSDGEENEEVFDDAFEDDDFGEEDEMEDGSEWCMSETDGELDRYK